MGRKPKTRAKSMLDRRFRERLREKREALGLSQSEVARRLGVRPATYHEIENGSASPNLFTVERISAELGIDPLTLLENSPSAT